MDESKPARIARDMKSSGPRPPGRHDDIAGREFDKKISKTQSVRRPNVSGRKRRRNFNNSKSFQFSNFFYFANTSFTHFQKASIEFI